MTAPGRPPVYADGSFGAGQLVSGLVPSVIVLMPRSASPCSSGFQETARDGYRQSAIFGQSRRSGLEAPGRGRRPATGRRNGYLPTTGGMLVMSPMRVLPMFPTMGPGTGGRVGGMSGVGRAVALLNVADIFTSPVVERPAAASRRLDERCVLPLRVDLRRPRRRTHRREADLPVERSDTCRSRQAVPGQ